MTAHRLTARNVAQALTQCVGNVSAAAKALGVTRNAVRRFMDNRPELRLLLDDLREARVDNAESALDRAVLNGEGWAVCFALKCLGKDRGYIERQELTGPGGSALAPTVVVIAFGDEQPDVTGLPAPIAERVIASSNGVHE